MIVRENKNKRARLIPSPSVKARVRPHLRVSPERPSVSAKMKVFKEPFPPNAHC